MLGKLAFKFLMFVATDGVGRVNNYVVLLKALGPSSSPSTFFILVVNFRGFSMYTGNFSNVHETPVRGGFAGLNGTSCSIGGFGGSFFGLAGIGGSSPKTSLGLLKSPMCLTR